MMSNQEKNLGHAMMEATEWNQRCMTHKHVMVSTVDWHGSSNFKQWRRITWALIARYHLVASEHVPRGHMIKADSVEVMALAAGYDSLEDAKAAYEKEMKEGKKRSKRRHTNPTIGMQTAIIGPFEGTIKPEDLPPEVAEGLHALLERAFREMGHDHDHDEDDRPKAVTGYDTPVSELSDILKQFQLDHAADLGDDEDAVPGTDIGKDEDE